MTRDEYKHEMRKVFRHREMRHSKIMPRNVYEYGWSIAQNKPQQWIVNRVLFWIFAYDRHHKWVKQDFNYQVNDEAYTKAQEMRKRRRKAKANRAKDYYNKPRYFDHTVYNKWEDCQDSLQKTLKKLGFNSLEEAVFGNKRSDQ